MIKEQIREKGWEVLVSSESEINYFLLIKKLEEYAVLISSGPLDEREISWSKLDELKAYLESKEFAEDYYLDTPEFIPFAEDLRTHYDIAVYRP